MYSYTIKNETVHLLHIFRDSFFCSDHQMKLQYQLEKQVGVSLLWCGIINEVRQLLFSHACQKPIL